MFNLIRTTPRTLIAGFRTLGYRAEGAVGRVLDRLVPLMPGELSTLDRLDNSGKAAEQGVRVTAGR